MRRPDFDWKGFVLIAIGYGSVVGLALVARYVWFPR